MMFPCVIPCGGDRLPSLPATEGSAMIAIDWGTTHLRAYRLGADGDILARRAQPTGIMAVPEGAFADTLAGVLEGFEEDDGPVLMSGMVGSRQGWIEVPYRDCPARLADLASGLGRVTFGQDRVAFICPGLACRDADGIPDVMRGEEVQIFGAMAAGGAAVATVCLPGTHSKHARLRDGAIESFTTHMTGEVFALLRGHSILGRTMQEGPPDFAAFDEGLHRAGQAGGLLHHIFGVRTRLLMGELGAPSLADYLSGILIGHEIARAPMAGPVLVVGAPELAARYLRACEHFGLAASAIDADTATTRGLHALAGLMGEIA
jgi:2-dehydro-3-deoxygalactonokinase